jgi:UDP-2,4-diacetamido-2,4,6-trideoxy-beta-L-altropyranose hydrolase
MRIVFRTDASLQIGSGHVMRCLTLADELRLRGADVEFVCREHHGNLIDFIEGKGYPVIRLPLLKVGDGANPEDLTHAEWLGAQWDQDAVDTRNAFGEVKVDWLIVDHYAIDHRWESTLVPQVRNIMVIDDLADRPHDCDILLDQNLYENMEVRYNNLVPDDCIRLLGPRFALLRPEFCAARKTLRQRNGKVGRVLVFFGGVDPTNETRKVLESLTKITARSFEVSVVVGSENPHKEQIQNFCANYDGFHYHCQVQNMAELMAEADLAFGAGGGAAWERCALGLPSIVTVIADNQKELAAFGARTGLFIKLGEYSDISNDTIISALRLALNSPETLQHYSQNCLDTVDAKGTERVVNLLSPVQITVRMATPADCDAIYAWRNAEITRQYFFNSEPVSIEAHRVWFLNSLTNPNRILLIGELDAQPIGVLRYDIEDNEALISVYLDPGMSGHGLGSLLIRCGSKWIRDNLQQVVVIKAEILKQNIASLRAFESAGYVEYQSVFRLKL